MVKSTRISHLALVFGGIAFGIWIGQMQIERPLGAEIREATPREAFQHGADRSETVLKEIHATLKVMDGRLERMEKAVSKRDEKK